MTQCEALDGASHHMLLWEKTNLIYMFLASKQAIITYDECRILYMIGSEGFQANVCSQHIAPSEYSASWKLMSLIICCELVIAIPVQFPFSFDKERNS